MSKIIRTSQKTGQPIAIISFEEYSEAQSQSAELAKDIDTQAQDVNRSIDVATALEELMVVADNIEQATPEEANLIELGGNIAVAGTGVTPEQIVPSLESFIGGKISLEELGLKEKIKKIWELIAKTLSEIWSKISEFIETSFVMVAYVINELRKVKGIVKDLKNARIRSEKMDLDVSRFGTIFNDGAQFLNDAGSIKQSLDKTRDQFKNFFENYVNSLTNLGDNLGKDINSINKENIAKVVSDLNGSLLLDQRKLFSTLFYRVSKTESDRVVKTTAEEKGSGLTSFSFNTDFLGGISYTVTAPANNVVFPTFPILVDRLKVSQIKINKPDLTKIAKVANLNQPYELGEIEQLLDATLSLMETIRTFKDRQQSKITQARKRLEQGSKALKSLEVEGADAENVKALMSLNLIYMNWARNPLIGLVQHAVRIGRAISWLSKSNLAYYEVPSKQIKK